MPQAYVTIFLLPAFAKFTGVQYNITQYAALGPSCPNAALEAWPIRFKRKKITSDTPRLPHTNFVQQATFTHIPCKVYDVQVLAHGWCSDMAPVASLIESI